jgi:hypothetical protein
LVFIISPEEENFSIKGCLNQSTLKEIASFKSDFIDDQSSLSNLDNRADNNKVNNDDDGLIQSSMKGGEEYDSEEIN